MWKVMGVAVALCSVVLTPLRASADDLCPRERVPEAELRRHEGELLERINRERVSRDLGTIAVDGMIAGIAREHAGRMAASGRVYHNPEYEDASRVGAEHVGEVPANGCSVRDVHELVMGSPADRATVLVPEWSEGGVGIASNDAGKLFVVEAFAQPEQRPAAPARQVEPPPAPSEPSPATPTIAEERGSDRAVVRTPAPTAEPAATPAPAVEVRVEAAPFRRVERGPEPASPRMEPHEAGSRVAPAGWWVAGLFAWSMLWALFGPGGPRKRRTRRLREPAGPRGAGGCP